MHARRSPRICVGDGLEGEGYMRVVAVILLALGWSLLFGCQKSDADIAAAALDKGLQAHQQGKVDEATAAYREVLAHDPNNKFAFYNLGLLEQTANRATAAENNYRMALSIDPNYGPALFNLAILRTAAGSTPEAIELYRKAIAAQPEAAGAHLNLGLLLRSTGQSQEGDAEVARALALDPKLGAPTAGAASR